MIPKKVGDSAWWAHNGTKEVTHPCPVCYGKLSVTVILGNDESVVTPCDYCGKGYGGPTGVCKEWEWVAGACLVTISAIETNDSHEGKEVRYRTYNHSMIDASDLFDTKEEAEARCEVRRQEHAEDERKRREVLKEYSTKSFSWHVGYHRREVKNHERSLEWHKSRVIACTRLAKTPIPAE